ncbi:immunoglobulin-like domain-containing protein [Hominifimenecus sp. rT4P-3]|uniref:immunoglobulin-like domain-containing protein n=1 Tax=Hominifimenecus sp. rT4P-3 TaxID=3242979 RepID=UPI003DA678BA
MKGKRRRKKSWKRKLILLTGLVLVAGLGCFLWFYTPDWVMAKVAIEAGAPMADVSDFLKKDGVKANYVTDVGEIDTSVPGLYPVEIRAGHYSYETLLEIVDRTPPEGTVRDLTIWRGDACTADDFIETASDVTGVTASFGTEPDWNREGSQEVEIFLTDGAGNVTKLPAVLTIFFDTEPPVIAGVADQTITEGDSISYKSGVTVTDNRDENLEITVDASDVNLEQAGTYTVVYTAEDSAGNRAAVSATITVKARDKGEANREEMEELAREALANCISDRMSDRDKLYEMFWYVKRHMNYTGDSDKTTQINEAIRGFEEKQGDCFTYFSVLKAMMEQAGFETVDVTRLGGETRHFWSLVKVGDEWYHIDSCPRSVDHNKYWYCFLRTDAELAKFSEQYDGYYNFDSTGLPKTP